MEEGKYDLGMDEINNLSDTDLVNYVNDGLKDMEPLMEEFKRLMKEGKMKLDERNKAFIKPDNLKPIVKDKKVNRNEICPYCDSGKKFKKCKCYNKNK